MPPAHAAMPLDAYAFSAEAAAAADDIFISAD